MYQLERTIKENILALVGTKAFSDWFIEENAKQEAGFIIFNNSFFFRQKLDTTKNRSFLCLNFKPDRAVEKSEIVIASNFPVNADYKFVSSKSKNLPMIKPLSEAMEEELASLGELLFILIGSVDDNIKHIEPINHALLSSITLDIKSKEKIRVIKNAVIIRDFFDEDNLWEELRLKCCEVGLIEDQLPENLLIPFAASLENLIKNSYSMLILPEAGVRIKSDTLIDKIKSSLETQAVEYAGSLRKINGDFDQNPTEFNNILRIAYNFASDATTLLRLLTSICDIKPIVFWMTLHDQFELSESFRNLPWKRTIKKPNLENYESTIKGARNSAFHHLFPFTRSLDVKLDNVSLKAKKLRLFSEYARKNENILEYQDKELVDIFSKFTRTEEKYVSPVFWKKNLVVMQKTIALLDTTSEALKKLAANTL